MLLCDYPWCWYRFLGLLPGAVLFSAIALAPHPDADQFTCLLLCSGRQRFREAGDAGAKKDESGNDNQAMEQRSNGGRQNLSDRDPGLHRMRESKDQQAKERFHSAPPMAPPSCVRQT